MPATGGVTGIVRTGAGTPAVGQYVALSGSGLSLAAYTDSSGRYTFNDVPVSGYTLTLSEPRTGIQTVDNITISADQMLAHDLQLVGLGALNVQVNFANGTPAPGVTVHISKPPFAPSFQIAGTTNASGQLVIANVPTTRPFTVRALNPLNTSLFSDVPGTLAAEGEVLPVTITLPGLGAVAGQVTYTGGAAAPAAPVRLYVGASTAILATATADAAGNFRFNSLPLGQTYRVRALNPAATLQFRDSANVLLSADGDVGTANVTLPAQAAVRVTVRRADGTFVTSGYVRVTDTFGSSQDYAINRERYRTGADRAGRSLLRLAGRHHRPAGRCRGSGCGDGGGPGPDDRHHGECRRDAAGESL